MKRLGWEHSEKGWQFCFSDCDVSADDISYREENGNFTLGFKAHIQAGAEMRKNDFERLMDVLRKAPDILYPVFVSNITALLYPIWQHQEQGSVMWIYGEPGSGKTELAMSLGTFVNREKRRSEGQSIFAANGNTKKLVERMQTHNGLNIVVDDVKKERVASQKDKWRKNVDTLIRSIYAQHLTDSFSAAYCDEEIHAGALITGEIVDIESSTKSRITFLPINDFINTDTGRNVISSLQEHPEWLVGTMCGIIQFLCKLWNDSGSVAYEQKFCQLATEERVFYRRSLASRLGNLSAMERMAHEFLVEYAHAQGIGDGIDFEYARAVVKETEKMLTNENDIFEAAFEKTLEQLDIQVAQFYMGYNRAGDKCYVDTGFQIKKEKDAIFIGKIGTLPGLGLYSEKNAILLVRASKFQQIFENELKTEIKRSGFQQRILLNNWVSKLRKRKMIFGEPRSDNSFNHVIGYPNRVGKGEKFYLVNLECREAKRLLNVNELSETIGQINENDNWGCFWSNNLVESDAYATIMYILKNFIAKGDNELCE